MIVNANLSSLSAQRMLFENSKAASTAMERLATGSKINKAQDDVAGFAIADRMTSQVRGLNMAVKNVNDAMAMLSVADSAASDITDMLQRMRELAIQAASDTNSAAERQYLQDEVDSLIQEIDRVATQTQYNGENLLDGSKNASFQIGASSGQTVAFEFRSLAVSSFTPATLAQTLDVSGGSATMNLSIDYQEENEIQFSGGYFRHVETGAIRQWQGYNFQDRTDKAVTWSSNTKSGEWELAHLYLQDNFGNRTELFSDDLQELGINFSVEVIGGSEDFDPPVITSFIAEIPANPESGDANSGDTSSTSTLTSDKFHLLGNTEATAAIVQITAAIETVTAQRAEYGAMQNRLQYTISNLMSVSENTVASRSRIEDADFATESAVLAKSQVLQQSGAAMLAQANARPQLVLQLIK
jgi:flagellin